MGEGINIIEPAFDFSSESSSTVLHTNNGEICIDGNNYDAEVEVRLELLPRANIYFYANVNNMPAEQGTKYTWGDIFGSPPTILLSIQSEPFDGFCIGRRYNVDTCTYTTKWCPSTLPIIEIGNDDSTITNTTYHLFNYVEFIVPNKNNHAKLACDKWEIIIKPVEKSHEVFRVLKEKGGYGLTHTGSIRKIASETYTGQDVRECFQALRFFLSFSKGYWCTPVCPVGFNETERRVWELWSSPEEPWLSPPSWFDSRNLHQLEELFPLFMKCWENFELRTALREVIYWYVRANHSSQGIDAGIILTQAAIERLAYEYAVKEKRLITAKGFKALWASDRFRLLFSSLGIPLDIPDDTPELLKLANDNNVKWLDAPHAITEIRNSLVHPDKKTRSQNNKVFYDTWNLGLWYLEMSILAVCGYSGTYGNRLKTRQMGQVDKVPWASTIKNTSE